MQFDFSPDYQCLFFAGYASGPAGPVRLGVVVVKRTWQRASAALSQPDPQQLPVLLADVPYNFVANADFDAIAPAPSTTPVLAPWTATGVTADVANVPGGKAVRLSGANGLLAQTIKFDQPLANRTFTFGVSAKTDPTAGNPNPSFPLAGTHLAAGSVTAAQVSGAVTQNFARYQASFTWPASVQDKEMQVVLGASGAAGLVIYYDQVQVEEFSGYPGGNPYFGAGEVVLENDLAAFKPRADLVVLDFNAPDGGGAAYMVQRRAATEQATALPLSLPARAIFGWSPRSAGSSIEPRRSRAGDAEHFDRSTMKLPAGFDNLFFNGMAAAPCRAGATDLTLDVATGIGAGDLLRIQGDVEPGETEFAVAAMPGAATGQVILVTPLAFTHSRGKTVTRQAATAGSALAVDTGRTMDLGQNLLAVTDAAALTLAANEVVRLTDLDNASRVQYVVVVAAGSRTIRGAFAYTFDVNRVKIEPITPGPVGGEPARQIAYPLPFTYFAAGETLTLHRIDPAGQPDYAWTLPAAAPAAAVTYRDAAGQEQTLPVPLVLDTVVLLRHSNRFYTVWRGSWLYDRPDGSTSVADENYVRLQVT